MGDPKQPYGNLRLFKAGEYQDSLGTGIQIAEATGENVEPLHYQGVRTFRRTVISIARPDGKPYAVDIFNVAGGDRQFMLWHSRGDVIQSIIPPMFYIGGRLRQSRFFGRRRRLLFAFLWLIATGSIAL